MTLLDPPNECCVDRDLITMFTWRLCVVVISRYFSLWPQQHAYIVDFRSIVIAKMIIHVFMSISAASKTNNRLIVRNISDLVHAIRFIVLANGYHTINPNSSTATGDLLVSFPIVDWSIEHRLEQNSAETKNSYSKPQRPYTIVSLCIESGTTSRFYTTFDFSIFIRHCVKTNICGNCAVVELTKCVCVTQCNSVTSPHPPVWALSSEQWQSKW